MGNMPPPTMTKGNEMIEYAHLFPTPAFGPERRAACGLYGGYQWSKAPKRLPLCPNCRNVAQVIGAAVARAVIASPGQAGEVRTSGRCYHAYDKTATVTKGSSS